MISTKLLAHRRSSSFLMFPDLMYEVIFFFFSETKESGTNKNNYMFFGLTKALLHPSWLNKDSAWLSVSLIEIWPL